MKSGPATNWQTRTYRTEPVDQNRQTRPVRPDLADPNFCANPLMEIRRLWWIDMNGCDWSNDLMESTVQMESDGYDGMTVMKRWWKINGCDPLCSLYHMQITEKLFPCADDDELWWRDDGSIIVTNDKSKFDAVRDISGNTAWIQMIWSHSMRWWIWLEYFLMNDTVKTIN